MPGVFVDFPTKAALTPEGYHRVPLAKYLGFLSSWAKDSRTFVRLEKIDSCISFVLGSTEGAGGSRR